jgi:predicted transcriptional regulator
LILNEILTEESLLNICLDNIVAELFSTDECYKYVTAYVMFKHPELDGDEIALKVRDLIADKIVSNLVSKGMIDYDWETDIYNVNSEGREFFSKNLKDINV